MWGILSSSCLCIIVMDDPVSMSAACGVLLHRTLTNIGLNITSFDDLVAPQGSSPSPDPFTRKNDFVDNLESDGLVVHI